MNKINELFAKGQLVAKKHLGINVACRGKRMKPKHPERKYENLGGSQ